MTLKTPYVQTKYYQSFMNLMRKVYFVMWLATVSGLIQPCHSYLIAAKYDFLSDNIRSDSIFYLKLSSNESGKSQIGNSIAATSPHLEDEVNVAVNKLLKANIPTRSLNTDMQINVPVSEPLDMMKHIDVDTPLPCLQNETASHSAFLVPCLSYKPYRRVKICRK